MYVTPLELKTGEGVDITITLAGGYVGGLEVFDLAAGTAIDLDTCGAVGLAVFGEGGGWGEVEGKEERKEGCLGEVYVGIGFGSAKSKKGRWRVEVVGSGER